MAELAERSGVPLALIEAVSREGLLVPRLHEGEPRYTADDVRIVSAGLRLLQAGLPLAGLLDLARRHHGAMRDVAAQAVEPVRHVRAPAAAGRRSARGREGRAAGGGVPDAAAGRRASWWPTTSAGCSSRWPRSTWSRWANPAELAAAGGRSGEDPVKPGAVLPTGDAKVAAVDAMFDAIAPRYDLLNRVMTPGPRCRLAAAHGADARLPAGRGRARSGLRHRRPVPGAGRAGLARSGVDRSAGMLAAATPAGADGRPWCGATASSLPVPGAASVDGVVCGFALRNFAALPPFFAECARVLRPGGTVAFLEVPTRRTRPCCGPATGLLRQGRAPHRRPALRRRRLPLPAPLGGLPARRRPSWPALLAEPGFTTVTRTPAVGGHRPAADGGDAREAADRPAPAVAARPPASTIRSTALGPGGFAWLARRLRVRDRRGGRPCPSAPAPAA